MDPPRRDIPQSYIAGLVPTLNHRGFMAERPDSFSTQFIDFAAGTGGEVLDIGCAYGVATLAALHRGARVCACDMESGHLELLAGRVPPADRPRLRTVTGTLPAVDFAVGAFTAVLAARVLHFLRGDEVRIAIPKMFRWLAPGGRLFIIVDTPYTGFWSGAAPEYERRKAAGEQWPGFIPDVAAFLRDGRLPDGMLPYLNPMDPDILRRECLQAGFVVQECGFESRDPAADPAGRQHAGLIAVRPA